MLEALKNSEGKDVYPSSASAFVENIPNASEVIFSDEEYNSLKSGVSNPNPDPTLVDQQGEPQNADPASTQQGADHQNAPGPDTRNDFDFEPIIKEKTGGKYSKIEEILSELESAPKLSDHGKKVFELVNNGQEEDVMNYYLRKQVLLNAEKAPAADRIKLQMQINNPEWSQEDVEDEFNLQYGLGFDENGVDDQTLATHKKRLERKINTAAKEADKLFAELNAELKFPELQLKDERAIAYANYEQTVQQRKVKDEALVADIDKVLPSFKNIDLSFTDKDVSFSHQFDIREEEKIQLQAELKSITEDPLSRYYKDGQWQTNKLIRDRYIADNLEKIVKSAVNKALATAKLATVKSIANADPGAPGSVPSDIGSQAALEAKKKFLLS